MDGEEMPPEAWGSVLVLNGDLGRDFPLGRGLSLGSGTFRVILLRYKGVRRLPGLLRACKGGHLLEDPAKHGAVVKTVQSLIVRPTDSRPYAVNVDGLRMTAKGELSVSVSGSVRLVAGPAAKLA
jgi:hypothetical protein